MRESNYIKINYERYFFLFSSIYIYRRRLRREASAFILVNKMSQNEQTSIQSNSLCPYCHSALSVRCKLNLDPDSSDIIEYVGSGGRKANLAAILEGHGGQQNKQHSSLKDNPFISFSLIAVVNHED